MTPKSESWLVRNGLRAWFAIGLIVLIAAILTVLATLSTLVVPLTVAILLGILFSPVVGRLHGLGLPRAAGAVLVLLGLVAITAWSAWLTVAAFLDQGGEISRALVGGVRAVDGWLSGVGGAVGVPEALGQELQNALRDGVGGISAAISSALAGALSGVWAFVIGAVVGTFFLYYILADRPRLTQWVGRRIPTTTVPGDDVVAAAVDSVRRYFLALTLSALFTVVVIGGTALILGVPLWLTIALMTFVTSYVPYLGAVISSVFATLITLGTQDSDAALVMLIVVLIVQNVLQTVVATNLTSGRLKIHPIVTLGPILVGGSVGGILGATLGSPVVATALRVRRLIAHDGNPPPAP